MKVLSLFDGSGGFPLAGAMCGIMPVAASEVEPFPIRVTTKRFPNMKHLGDISKINGAEIEPVDVITFGSPCQDLSVAGKRKGLNHSELGDEETTRSGLFMEAVRIIREMKEATNGEYPTFAVWENVPGAYSSNKGEDFRIVLEELEKTACNGADIVPKPPKGKWLNAGEIVGDNYSIAWRTLDAQFWGVPQRRRRIYLVADFRGKRAGKILFEREGLRGDFTQSGTPWQGTVGNAQDCTGTNDTERTADASRGLDAIGVDVYNQTLTGEKAKTLNSAATDADHVPCVAYTMKERAGCAGGGIGTADRESCIAFDTYNMVPMLTYGLDRASFNQGENAKFDFSVLPEQQPTMTARGPGAVCYSLDEKMGQTYISEEQANTLAARDYKQPQAVAFLASGKESVGTLMASMATKQCLGDQEAFSGDYHIIENRPPQYIVRRLTPLECCRLQGFPDWWCSNLETDNPTESDIEFWREVFETHRTVISGTSKPKTDKQIIKWLKDPYSDSAIYKMWGNGIALPNALFVMQGIAEELCQK